MIGLLLALAATSQIPATDIRNTCIRHTDYKFDMPKYATLAEWEAHKAHLKRQILVSAGLAPLPEKTPLHTRVFDRIEHEDYTIEKVALETMPGFYLGGNLYRPAHAGGKRPAVLMAHGHWTYGRLENSEGFSGPALGISLARQGYVAFAYDMVGYNDTLQTEHRFETPIYQLWSFGPLALQLWNSIRALDFVESLPGVDTHKIGVTGASGGATQAFLLAAVDDRIRFAAPVNMVSFLMQGGCKCENAPGLRIDTSNVEIAAMIVPRPMLLVSATGDWTKNVPREEYPAIRSIYELYGKPENLGVVQFQAEHNYNRKSREAVYAFFGKHVLGDNEAAHFVEKNAEAEPLLSMLVWQGRALPDNALTQEQIFAQWKRVRRARVDALDARSRRELLLDTFHAEWPAKVVSEQKGESIVLSRLGRGDRVTGIWLPGKGPAVIVVHPEGSDAARRDPRVQTFIRAGRPVLLLDVFQTGEAMAKRDLTGSFFNTFNATDDANRVQDILTALSYVDAQQAGEAELVGIGKASMWTVFAKNLAPVEVKLTADNVSFSDEAFLESLFVPGVQLIPIAAK
jgi:dienelactone hydrolase